MLMHIKMYNKDIIFVGVPFFFFNIVIKLCI